MLYWNDRSNIYTIALYVLYKSKRNKLPNETRCNIILVFNCPWRRSIFNNLYGSQRMEEKNWLSVRQLSINLFSIEKNWVFQNERVLTKRQYWRARVQGWIPYHTIIILHICANSLIRNELDLTRYISRRLLGEETQHSKCTSIHCYNNFTP